jgi:hypothetical protein
MDNGFGNTSSYDGHNDFSSTFTIPEATWWYGKDVYVVITVSNCGVDSDGIPEDPYYCEASAASPYYGDGVTNLGGGVVIPYKANLFDLALSSGTLSTTFNSATTSYTASVSNTTSSITVTPSTGTVIPFVDPNDRNATTQVRVNGGEYARVLSGESSTALALNVGANPIDVKVTAQDGTTTKTYTVTVTRAASSNAYLSALALSSGGFTSSFASGTLGYTAASAVSNATTSVTVTPTKSDSNATIKVKVNTGSYVTVASGSASGSLSLNVGSNTISVEVTAEDGTTIKTYTVTVTRAASSNADLSALALSSGTLSPTFDSGTTSYTASVANSVATGYTVTPTKSDSNASFVKYLGSTGTTAFSGALAVGANVIRTVVTAEDGTTIKTYTVTVTRAAFVAAPITVKELSDYNPPARGGDELTITGTGFNPDATVTIGTGDAAVHPTILKRTGTTKIMFRVPFHAPGIATFVVANPGGGSVSVPGFKFNGSGK